MPPISGTTRLIAHLGYPTTAFTAPLIYNPWFQSRGIDAAVVPMGVREGDLATALLALRNMSNFHGALVTMPHKTAVVPLLDSASAAVRQAGSCNAVRLTNDGHLAGDLFDGEGFLRALRGNGFDPAASRALVVGAGGAGRAIASALADAGARSIDLVDTERDRAATAAGSLAAAFPACSIAVADGADAGGYDLVVNASPAGSRPGDAVSVDVTRIPPDTLVADVVLGSSSDTPLLAAARARGCRVQAGIEMLFAQIPLYLEFFGFGGATVEELRAVSGM